VLSILEAGGWRDKTDVLVVSDHGFSTISERVDIAGLLTQAGLSASRQFKAPPKPGDILVDSLGGSSYLYVIGHDKAVAAKAVECLQKNNAAGVIFTRDTLPGTFPLSAAHIDSPDAPDIAVAYKWTDDKNAAGAPGGVFVDGTGGGPLGNVGQGTHASLSRYDLHNTLIAIGPDFKSSWRDELPTSNADLAPTIAYLLGLPPGHMDGRVLTEALTGPASAAAPAPTVTTERLEAASGNWKQYLQVTHCGGEIYLDEGN
jgi:arylsulfatase A-like enzyme